MRKLNFIVLALVFMFAFGCRDTETDTVVLDTTVEADAGTQDVAKTDATDATVDTDAKVDATVDTDAKTDAAE